MMQRLMLRVARRRCDEWWWSGGAIGVVIGVGSGHVVDQLTCLLFLVWFLAYGTVGIWKLGSFIPHLGSF